MYLHIQDVLVEEFKIASRLPEPVWVDINGVVVEDEPVAFGCKSSICIDWCDMGIMFDAVGSNLSDVFSLCCLSFAFFLLCVTSLLLSDVYKKIFMVKIISTKSKPTQSLDGLQPFCFVFAFFASKQVRNILKMRTVT